VTVLLAPAALVTTIPSDEDVEAPYIPAAAAAVYCCHWQQVLKPDSVERQLKSTVSVAAWLHLAVPRQT